MSTLAEKLKKRRREEQEIRGYANSSRWYTGLSNAISFLERAETATDPLSRFSDAWAVAYNLFMMHGEPGDEEFRRFNSWISSVKDSPGVRHNFVTAGDPLILAFRQAVERVKNILLKPQGLQELQSWAGKGVSPEKACRYFFTITRDIRNTAFHPGFNPTAPVKKAIGAAADCLLPIVAAAVEATIEHPVPNTTGKATAYRFFLYPFLKNSDGFFSDYYLERLFPDEELGAFPEDQSKELFKQISKHSDAKGASLQTADGEGTLSDWLEPVLFSVLGINAVSGVRVVTEDAVFQPNLVLPRAGVSGHKAGVDLKGKDAGKSLSCMIWTLPWRVSLDSVATEPPFTSLPITEVVHRALAASEVPWAIITNGRQLRLLSRVSSHKPRCFLEADLVALIDRRTDAQAGRAFRFLLGLFSGRCFTEADAASRSLLDRVAEGSDRHGKEIGDELKANVFSALEELGEGFLDYLRANPTATSEWRDRRAPGLSREKFLTSDVLLDDIYHESLSLMYRLLFLFYAESRELLPLDNELYQTYSLEAIRDDVHSVQDDPDPKRFYAKGNADLWARLKELFGFLDEGWGKVIPPYNGGLFDPEKHEFLEKFAVGDYYLARAIDLLSWTKPRIGQNRGEGRKKVTYRDLDVRHLGSIYEGILEYKAQIAAQEYVILREGFGAAATEEYVEVAELDQAQFVQLAAWKEAVAENPENPRLPRGCKVVGNVEAGQYYLAFGGRDSKRKSSGSYYTPDYIVQYIVENTLGPLVQGESRPRPEPITNELKAVGWKEGAPKDGPLTSKEILELKVVDPAMGSGHFLVAATEFLARSYRDALLSEGLIPDEVKADQEFIRYKRIIAERCIYGVDLNPMAVELAKLSMWLFTMDPGRPLSFLDHRLKCGNALVGAWTGDLGRFPTANGGLSAAQTAGNLFDQQFQLALPLMVKDLFGISQKETMSTQDIRDKKVLDANLDSIRRPFVAICNAWTSIVLGEACPDYLSYLANVSLASSNQSQMASDHRFFSWQLQFPDAFFSSTGAGLANQGFSAIVGNPPYIGFKAAGKDLRPYYSSVFGDAYDGKADIYCLFALQSLRLLAPTGRLGLITGRYWLEADTATGMRQHLETRLSSLTVLDFSDLDLFENVTTKCSIILGGTSSTSRDFRCLIVDDSKAKVIPTREWPTRLLTAQAIQALWTEKPNFQTVAGAWRFRTALELEWTGSIERSAILLSEFVDTKQGVVSGLDDAFILSKSHAKELELPDDVLRPYLKNYQILPNRLKPSNEELVIVFTPLIAKKADVAKWIKYIDRFRPKLSKRRECQSGLIEHWQLQWPRTLDLFDSLKLLTRKVQPRNCFVLDSDRYVCGADVSVARLKDGLDEDSAWLLNAYLNSTPCNAWCQISLKKMNWGYEYSPGGIQQIPIPKPVVDLVGNAGSPAAKHLLTIVRRWAHAKYGSSTYTACAQQIDATMYELLGLKKTWIDDMAWRAQFNWENE